MDEVVFAPVRQLAELVRTRQVSPVELAETFLHRLETVGPRYNAVVTVAHDRAMEQARRAEEEIATGKYRGPLHGIPYGAKDLLATSGGIPTTWGAEPFRDRTFDYDATVVRKLEAAGAVLAAKLSMVEFAGGIGGYNSADAAFNGPGINPWDETRWSGGSSSGSGSAVAAGLVPFAIGTETQGSILFPSSYCGLSGLRPTYGRVSRYGAMALSWTLDKIGPMCLTADDCGLVLQSIAGPDADDPTAADRPFEYRNERTSDGQFKLAVHKSRDDDGSANYKNFARALDDLSAVATIDEVELPDLPYDAAQHTIQSAESASAFEDVIEDGLASELRAEEDRYPYARTAILATDYIKALRLRTVTIKAADDLLSGYDALAEPGFGIAPSIEPPLRDPASKSPPRPDTLTMGNVAGVPTVVVPSGFTNEGLPTGIRFIGRAHSENAILAAPFVSLIQLRQDSGPPPWMALVDHLWLEAEFQIGLDRRQPPVVGVQVRLRVPHFPGVVEHSQTHLVPQPLALVLGRDRHPAQLRPALRRRRWHRASRAYGSAFEGDDERPFLDGMALAFQPLPNPIAIPFAKLSGRVERLHPVVLVHRIEGGHGVAVGQADPGEGVVPIEAHTKLRGLGLLGHLDGPTTPGAGMRESRCSGTGPRHERAPSGPGSRYAAPSTRRRRT